MSTRRSPESESDSDRRLQQIGARVRQRALTGAEASTVGLVLVLSIGLFAALGYWLDSYFKTSWIVAVGVLVGAVFGFREMFRMAQRLGRQSIRGDAANLRRNTVPATLRPSGAEVVGSEAATTGEAKPASERRRIFQVPAPPVSRFDRVNGGTAQPPADAANRPISADELLEKMLDESDLDNENDASQP